MDKFLKNHPLLRRFIRWLRWQVKKVPVLRDISIAVDTYYFRAAGNERRTEEDYKDGDDYFESYAGYLESRAHGSVLDLGCGYGYLTKRLANKENVKEVVGLDKISGLKVQHPKIKFQSCDITSAAALPDGPYDVINSSEFVEHIYEDDFRNLLRKIVTALAPDGIYIGSTPRNPTPYKVFSGSRYHLREYNAQDLKSLLSEYFQSVDVKPVSEYCLVWEAKRKKSMSEIEKNNKIRLHLGCGDKYMEGYVNVDYPQSEHSVMKVRADVYSDMMDLSYPENSIDEIRSHHLFEHFNRAEALSLLMRWRRWLKPGGLLLIETPDFGACARAYTLAVSQRRKFQLWRHILGSQEARWANHYDYWDKSKGRMVLEKFGFRNIKCKTYHNRLAQHYPHIPFLNFLGRFLPDSFYRKHGGHRLPNLVMRGEKDANRTIDEKSLAREILSYSLVGREGDEMLNVWLGQVRWPESKPANDKNENSAT
ncbi:MAG TPA: methyltransferase domain-containing protein [Candidatus Paceibacterota bacterium]